MRKLSSLLLITALFATGVDVFAADGYYVSDGETKIGEWNSNIKQTIAKGEADNIPIVMVGTAFGCSICANFKATILPNEKFKKWVANSPYYFLYAYSGSGWWTTPELKAFIDIVGNGGLPRIGGYWKKKDGTIVKGSFTGGGVNLDYYINYWDKLFKDYDPNTNDKWDPADDAKAGATDLGAPAATATITELHYINAIAQVPDKEDWFKMTLSAGKRYCIYQDLSTFENVAPKVDVIDPSGNVIETVDAGKEMFVDSPCVFTAEAAGTYYIRFYYSGKEGKATYKLAYREFEPVVFGFKSSEVSVKENAGNAVLTLTRSGRLTDEVGVLVSTSNGTAVAGTDYKALSGAVVKFPAKATEATVSVPVTDIPGNQGNKQFTVICVNPEDASNNPLCTVLIEDLDIPTDAKDPGDDVVSGATAFDITDETQTVKAIEDASRVQSGSDVSDWFRFNTLAAGKTYQIKVPAGSYSRRPESGKVEPLVAFYVGEPGSLTRLSAAECTLSELEAKPYRFVADADLPLYVQVTNAAPDTTVYTYDLAWQEWVLPIVSFTNDTAMAVSAGGAAKTETIVLKRTKNLEEKITVNVEIAGDPLRVQNGTNEVVFAAESDTATMPLRLFLDGGMWTPDQMVTLKIVEDGNVHNPEGAVHTQVITLKTEMPEFDADDGPENANSNAANAKAIPVTKRPTTRDGLTLNGTDKADWYAFPVVANVEYVFELVNLQPEAAEPLPLKVEVQLPGGGSTDVALSECSGTAYHLIAPASGNVAIGVFKTADEPESIKYALKYREWVPATIGLVSDKIVASEFASSVRIPVRCDMEVALPVSIRVKTQDGTAKAGEDYVALDAELSWDEFSPTSSVKYATVNLKKLIAEYEGAYEEFGVYLDFSTSEGIAGAITNLTVQVKEEDVGSVGTFAITGYSLDGGVTVKPYQAKYIPVTAGDPLQVRVARTGGNAGEVKMTLTWTDGTVIKETMADLETEKWIDTYIPDSDGQYVARQIKSVALTTDVKNAKTRNAQLTFSITDSDTTLQTYAAYKTNLAVSSSGNSWYVGADGLVRTRKSAKVGETMSMTTSLKGPGRIAFKKIQSGMGTIIVKAGTKVLELEEKDDTVSALIPSGTQRITIIFVAAEKDAFLAIDEFAFIPDEEVFYIGTFYGSVALNEQLFGLATLTAAKSGRVSGKFTMPSNQTWTVTGKLVDGAADDAVVRRMKVVLDDSKIRIANFGELDMEAGVSTETAFDVIGSRSGWSDRPLTGVYAECADLLGRTLEYTDADGVLAFKVGANGNTRVAGNYNGKRISASVVPFAREGKLWAVLVNSTQPNGILFRFVNTDGVWSVEKGE